MALPYFIYLFTNWWTISLFGSIRDNVAMSIYVQAFVRRVSSFFLGVYLVEFLGHVKVLGLTFCFTFWLHHFTNLPARHQVLDSPHLLFVIIILVCVKWTKFIVVWICDSLLTDNVEQLLGVYICIFGYMSVHVCVYFSVGFFVFLISSGRCLFKFC